MHGNTTHGDTLNRRKTLEFSSWDNMIQRCTNPRKNRYEYYGGRGIVCFLTNDDIAALWRLNKAGNLNRPTLDRINNNGPYALWNCQFIEAKDNISKAHRKWGKCQMVGCDNAGIRKGLCSSHSMKQWRKEKAIREGLA